MSRNLDFIKFNAAGTSDAGVPTGMIAAFSMNAPPIGWLSCNGAEVDRITYSDLFIAISTAWGVGDGSTTFNVPELKGAILKGVGVSDTSTDYVGPTAVGAFQDDQNASHSHSGSTNTTGDHTHTSGMSPDNTWNGPHFTGTYQYGWQNTNLGTTTNGNHSHTVSINADGGTEVRVYNRGVQYCIKY